MPLPLANTLPASNDGYVAAAYIVFFAIVLIYVAIMAVRLGRVERRVRELGSQTRQAEPGESHETTPADAMPSASPTSAHSPRDQHTPSAQEREPA